MSKTNRVLTYLCWWSIAASVGSIIMLSLVSVNFYIPGASFVATTLLLLGMTGMLVPLLGSVVLLLLFLFGAKGVKMHSPWLPAVAAVPVLADIAAFFYYLINAVFFGGGFVFQTIPSFVYSCVAAVFLVLYFVGIFREKKNGNPPEK